MIKGIMIGFLLALVLMAGVFLRFFAKSRYPGRTNQSVLDITGRLSLKSAMPLEPHPDDPS